MMAFIDKAVARWKEERQRKKGLLEWMKSGKAKFGTWSPGAGSVDTTPADIERADSSSLTNTLRISCRDGVGGHVHQRGEHLVGCRKAKRLALLSRVAIASSSACETTDRSVPLGRYWRSRPLVFSLEPRCHGACGSAK